MRITNDTSSKDKAKPYMPSSISGVFNSCDVTSSCRTFSSIHHSLYLFLDSDFHTVITNIQLPSRYLIASVCISLVKSTL